MNGFKELVSTRCNPWDNRELDIIEGFKFASFLMLQFLSTSLFLNGAPQYNVWKMLDFLQQLFFTVVISCNMATDLFIVLSGFLGAYKCLQIYEANGGKIYFKDMLKLYARKFLRLAPMLYLIFFFGWASGSRFSDGPVWINYQALFY
jgi:peptidoglycan/LPS O-acetylase OafA/YrhL